MCGIGFIAKIGHLNANPLNPRFFLVQIYTVARFIKTVQPNYVCVACIIKKMQSHGKSYYTALFKVYTGIK